MSKVKKIVKAIVSEKPIDELWYQERLSLCKKCPHNTSNGAEIISKGINITKAVCLRNEIASGSKETCSKCTCSIPLKTSLKDEECPMGFWKEQETVSSTFTNTRDFSITPYSIDVEHGVNEFGFYLNHGKIENVNSRTVVQGGFELFYSSPFQLTEANPTCGCTTVVIEKANKKSYKIKYSIDVSTMEVHIKTINIKVIKKSNFGANEERIIPVKIKFKRNEI